MTFRILYRDLHSGLIESFITIAESFAEAVQNFEDETAISESRIFTINIIA